jgi:uncharacterized protein (DUF2062 family)
MLFTPRHKRSFAAKARNWLWPERGMKRAMIYQWRRLTRITATPHQIALGLAIGIFMGFSPFVGLHMVTAAFICLFSGGSVLAAALGTMVCNPISCPIMLISDYKLGTLFFGDAGHLPDLSALDRGLLEILANPVGFAQAFWGLLGPVFLPLLAGGAVLGLLFATPSYFLVRRGIQKMRGKRSARLLARRQELSA